MAIVGCSEQKPYKLAVANGVVKIGGKPAKNVMVRIIPIPANKTIAKECPTSTGVTGEDGAFDLKTLDGREGAVPGRCFVELVDLEEEVPKEGRLVEDEESRAKPGRVLPKPGRIPPKYTTGRDRLIVEVKENNEPIVIDIRS